MLDLKFVLRNMDLVLEKLQKRLIEIKDLDNIVVLSNMRKELIQKIEKIRFRKNNVSQVISELKHKSEQENQFNNDNFKSEQKSEQISKKDLKEFEKQLQEIEQKISHILYNIPNIPHDSVPVGTDENDNVEVFRFLEPKKFSFPVKDHIELGKNLDILDFERATKITGSKFVVLKGAGARLERSLINFMLDVHISKGYEEILSPFIVNKTSMFSTGQLPKFKKDLFKLKLDKHEWYLNPTAEVPMVNFHRDDVLDKNQLPLKYVGFTTCFRQEAGANGLKSKGIFRQKQFNKVELVQFVEPQNSYKALEEMLKDSEYILQKLNLPYRILTLSTGDLGFSASKTYDIEVWIPSQNRYREIASISNTESFQARRANIKLKDNTKNKKEYLHILNGSALAVGRTMMAIIENYQDENGHIVVPEVLHDYFKENLIK
ncbi:serine--tRNA ligase ['Camptotheca acuminata' phytoplasma]|uniref:serine--tRNA ligase n=1 Tax='Camptotheca acuminata' phytoplasma TaxID=3239192 RepID=UPI003519F97F